MENLINQSAASNNEEQVHFRYVIKMCLGDLSRNKNGWSKQANIIKWNNGIFKLDIRDWNNSKQQMRRGITLSRSEVERLLVLLRSIDMRLIDDYESEQVKTATFRVTADSLPIKDSYDDLQIKETAFATNSNAANAEPCNLSDDIVVSSTESTDIKEFSA